MGIIGFFYNVGISVLCIIGGILLFGAIVGKGTGTIRQLLKTLNLAINVGCIKLRKKLIKGVKEEPKTEDDNNSVEAHIV